MDIHNIIPTGQNPVRYYNIETKKKITGTSIRLPHKHNKELRHQAQLLVVYKV